MEFFPLGDLAACLDVPLVEHHAKDVTTQLLEGLIVMHDLGFTHRDLKPKVSRDFSSKPYILTTIE